MSSDYEEIRELAGYYKKTGQKEKYYQALDKLESLQPVESQAEKTASPKSEKSYDWRGLANQALQGASFGAADEVGAALLSVPAALKTGTSVGDAYSGILGNLSEERKEFKEENPYSALAAELAGGVATGALSASKMAGSKILNKALGKINMGGPLTKTAVIGGTQGAAYGGLSADQGERMQGAAIGGAGGAVLAPVFDVGAKVAKNFAEPVINRVKQAISSTPQGDAKKYLADVLAREGFSTIQDATKQARGDVDVSLADLTEGGRGALTGILYDVENPAIKKLAREKFAKRNDMQQSRIFKNLEAKLGISPNMTIKQAVDSIEQERAIKAKPLYDEARSKGLRMTPYMTAIMDKKKGVPEVRDALKQAMRYTATKRATGEKVSHIDIIDEMKRVLDDKIDTHFRSGAKNRARDLRAVKNKILQQVDEQIPSYKKARNYYAGQSALLEAGEKGKYILREDVDNLEDMIVDMSKSEREMFRLGAMKAIREKLMMAREGTNSVNRIASELNLEKMKKAFPDEQAFNRFKDDLKFESKIFETSRILHNSITSFAQAAQRDFNEGGSGQLGKVITDPAGAISGGFKAIFDRKMSIEAKEELGKMILAPVREMDPKFAEEINKLIMKKLPDVYRKPYMKLLNDVAEETPKVLPAVGVPIVNDEQ